MPPLLTAALLFAATALGSRPEFGATFPPFHGDQFVKYNLSAHGIRASFIPYGARITNLFVEDRNGDPQDVVVGYDEGRQYLRDTETNHTYFGAVVGRYANRIKNGTFVLGNTTSHIPTNEHHGANTLHGGFIGYDQQNWTVTALTSDSITFTFYDAAQSGFPGDVLNIATYTLTPEPAWVSRLVSIPLTAETPLMLSNHVYWNLGAFTTSQAQTVLDNTLHMPYAKRYIGIDAIEVPTGQLYVTRSTPLDFTTPKTIGAEINQTADNCGTGCLGYDNAFILDRPSPDPNLEVLALRSPDTGIRMRVSTDQHGLQIYSCNGQKGTIPVKRTQQHGPAGNGTFVQKFGCVVIETQDWIDGVNHPEWGRDRFQVFSPTTRPAVNYAKYVFDVV